MRLTKVTLVYPSRLARLFGAGLRIGSATAWAYLGRNAQEALRWEQRLGREGLDLRATFRRISLENRRPFLDWIAEIGARQDDCLLWYTSRIGEKNPLVDRLYHRCCLYLTGKESVGRQPEIALVCEDAAVFRSLRESFPDAETRWPHVPPPAWVEWGIAKAKFVAKAALHLRRVWRDRRLARQAVRRAPALGTGAIARAVSRASNGSKTIVMHSCLDPTFLTSGQDRYFTSLPSELRRQGHRVLLLPWIFIDGGWRERFYARFAEQPDQVLLPDLFYRWRDYAWSLRQVWRLGGIPADASSYAGEPSWHWIRASRLQQGHDVTLAMFFRQYRLPERLRAAGVGFDTYIDTFENMVSEKAMILGLRRSAPEVRTVGYQHWASPAPLMLCNFVSTHDTATPLPDRIVAYSEFTREVLSREGYPAERLVVGPSLRYGQPPLSLPTLTDARRIALLVLPLERPQAIATLRQYLGGLARCRPEIRDRIQTRIKPHPMLTEREWVKITTAVGLPSAGFERVAGTLREQLEAAHFAVTAASTAAIEIALSGRPLVQMSLWMDLDLDSLAWFGDRFPTQVTQEELADALTRVCTADESTYRLARETGLELYDRCISTTDATKVARFVA